MTIVIVEKFPDYVTCTNNIPVADRNFTGVRCLTLNFMDGKFPLLCQRCRARVM